MPQDASAQNSDTAFIIFTHYENPRIEALIDRARRDLDGRADVVVSAYVPDPAVVPPIFSRYAFAKPFFKSDFDRLGYPFKVGCANWRFIPGNGDLVPLALWRQHPSYRRIWLMEGDVEYTGDLGALLARFDASDADLLCTSIRPMPRYWYQERLTRVPEGWPDPQPPLTGFLPFFRASDRLLGGLDRFYREGGAGHHERTWPLVARNEGLVVEDLGGDGPYTRPENRGRHYSSSPSRMMLFPGTFRFRPSMRRAGARPETLWHPIKENADLPREYARYVLRAGAIGLALRAMRAIAPSAVDRMMRRRHGLED